MKSRRFCTKFRIIYIDTFKWKRLILCRFVINSSFNSAVVFLTHYKLELNSSTFKIRLLTPVRLMRINLHLSVIDRHCTFKVSTEYFDQSECSVTQLSGNLEYEKCRLAVLYLPSAAQARMF